MAQVSLSIKGKVFRVNKDMLCEYSDYFRAMFSGNYIENKLQEIKINNLEPDTMEIILKYMQIGLIDLSDHSLSTVEDIAVAASFLQITELMKQIEYVLDFQISDSNWIQIMSIAEQCSFSKLEKLAVSHGLLSFKNMEPHYIPSIRMLAWYLSHPCLDSDRESQIFKFGYEWLLQNETGADALLIILGCLDINKITSLDINEIKDILKDYKYSLAAKVVDCLHDLFLKKQDLTCQTLQDQRNIIFEKFTERVYTEVINIVRNSTVRKLLYTPVIPIWLLKNSKPEYLPQYLFSFTNENKFQQWLEVADKNLWGWSIVSWRPSKIIVVCGEHGRGTGIFMRDVKVYDTFRKEWTWHGVQLPQQRHAGCAVIGDSLFIVGGVGAFRVVLDSAIIYDLKQRSFRKIAKFPDAIQNPAICSLDNNIYAAGHKNIYRYVDQGDGKDLWEAVVSTDIRMSCMRSYNKYIYCTQSYFSNLYRFRPGIDKKLELITSFSSPPSTMCNMRDNLVVFTRTVSDVTSVEVLRGDKKDEKPNVIYTTTSLRVNEVAGSCVVALESPAIEWKVSPYVMKYLHCYNE